MIYQTTDDGSAWATFSHDMTRRYVVGRCFDPCPPAITWIMCNPSTADAFRLDPTVSRVVKRSIGLGYGTVYVVNVSPYRATRPEDMIAAHDAGVDVWDRDERDAAIRRSIEGSRAVVYAWGSLPFVQDEADRVDELVRHYQRRPLCLGTTKNGSPRHPLYVRNDAELVPWGGR